MIKLTVEQFTDQANSSNIDYINNSIVITGSGIVNEDEQRPLCGGEALYNFMYEDPDFDGVFDQAGVIAGITFMNAMA